MKKILLIALISLVSATATHAQSYITKNGKISFFSKTAMENIDAVNNQVVSVLDSKTGVMQFSVQVTGFIFKKALMQEHYDPAYQRSRREDGRQRLGVVELEDLGVVDQEAAVARILSLVTDDPTLAV